MTVVGGVVSICSINRNLPACILATDGVKCRQIFDEGGAGMQAYQGKYFSVLGDSISTLDGYNPPENAVFYDWKNKMIFDVYTPSDTWWGYVIESLGGQLLVNDAPFVSL